VIFVFASVDDVHHCTGQTPSVSSAADAATITSLRNALAAAEAAAAEANTRAEGFRKQWQTLADRAMAQMDAEEQMEGVKVRPAPRSSLYTSLAITSVMLHHPFAVCVAGALLWVK
jgi:hypothetical protein